MLTAAIAGTVAGGEDVGRMGGQGAYPRGARRGPRDAPAPASSGGGLAEPAPRVRRTTVPPPRPEDVRGRGAPPGPRGGRGRRQAPRVGARGEEGGPAPRGKTARATRRAGHRVARSGAL